MMAKDLDFLKRLESDRISQAYKDIPEKYHQFIKLLHDEEFVGYKREFNQEQIEHYGIYFNGEKGFITIQKPYMSVNGRIRWARDDHRENNAKMFIRRPEVSPNGQYLSVEIESELHGSAPGSSMINVDGVGFDATSPIECAETAAIGRALAALGYGIIGEGIASAEEVLKAIKAKEQMKVPPKKNNIKSKERASKSERKSNSIHLLVKEKPIKNNDGTVSFLGKVILSNGKDFEVNCLAHRNIQKMASALQVDFVIEVEGTIKDTVCHFHKLIQVKGKQSA